ncbi:MAG: alpha-E domain-containing protein, partial [bacterium]
MLGRVANNIYWMHRYRERAEDLARLIEVSLNLNIDLPESQTQWEPLLQTTGDYENFKKLYPETTKENVIKFLTFDSENPNSIYSSFTKARDNARTIREIISSEMWHELNTVYLFVHHCKTNN